MTQTGFADYFDVSGRVVVSLQACPKTFCLSLIKNQTPYAVLWQWIQL